MAKRLCLLLALVVAAGGQIPAQQLPPGYVDPGPVLAAASKAINEQSLRCITFSGVGYSGPCRADVRERGEHRLAAQRDGELHAHDQLGDRHEQRDVRPQARQQSGVVEIRSRLGRRHPHAGEPPADAHRQRPVRVAHRRRRRARRGSAGDGRCVSTRRLAEPARVSQGRAHARRQSEGARGDGSKSRKGATATSSPRARARRRHHGAREVSRRRDDQQPEHHHAPQGDGERERARRFQHRAGVDRVRARRAVAVADQLALASGLGRQLAVLPRRAPATTPTAASFPTCRRTSATIPFRFPNR